MKRTIILSLFLAPALLLYLALSCSNKDNEDEILTEPPVIADTLYINPLFVPDLADPTFIRAEDGWFYAYGTENTWSPGVNRITPIIRSKNMVKWEFVANAFSTKPSWKSSGGIWAPQIVFNKRDSYYYLYYSFSVWGDPNPGIGVAKSKNPDGPFEDLGKILDSQSSGVPNSIDQFYIETGSGENRKAYLFWGSYHGIYGIEMNDDMKTTKGENFQITGNAFEGTYIYEFEGKFYFFGSSGNCCDGANSQYRLSVAVADNIKGPYKTKDGKDIINNGQEGTPFLRGDRNNGWVGPGHNGEIIRDDKGRFFILFHAISVSNPLLPNGATRRPLLMEEIIWKDGWPTIENGVPSLSLKTAPYFKD
jgi:arabinan endo-1,5-alpha-L-arabinosidase